MKSLIITVLIAIYTFYIYKTQEDIYNILKTTQLLFEIRQSLNEARRLFIINGDTFFLNNFKNILEASNGLIPWSNIQDQSLNYTNGIISLQEIIKETNYTKDEKKIIEDLHKERQKLVWYNITALNLAQGKVDKNDEKKKEYYNNYEMKYIEFTEKSEIEGEVVNKLEALKIFETEDYNKVQENVTLMLENLVKTISQRVTKKLKIIKWFYLISLIIYSIIIVKTYNKNKENEKDMKSVYNLSFLISGILSIYLGLNMYISGMTRLRIFILSNLMQDIDTYTTRDARDYAKTGDEKYFNDYWKKIRIYNGEESWHDIFPNIKYWSLEGSVIFDKKNEDLHMSLNELLEKNDYTEEEMIEFNKARHESDSQTWLDIESMNWRRKRWDKNNNGRKIFEGQNDVKNFILFEGTYNETKEGEIKEGETKPENPEQKAVDILYSKEYISMAEIINKSSHKFEKMAIKRVDDTINRTLTLFSMTIIMSIMFQLKIEEKF